MGEHFSSVSTGDIEVDRDDVFRKGNGLEGNGLRNVRSSGAVKEAEVEQEE